MISNVFWSIALAAEAELGIRAEGIHKDALETELCFRQEQTCLQIIFIFIDIYCNTLLKDTVSACFATCGIMFRLLY